MNPSERVVTWDDLAVHSSKTNLWIVIDGNVYDVTTYLAEHPGGDDVLVKHGGIDATKKFKDANHSDYAVSLRNARLIGKMENKPMPENYEANIKKSKPKAQVGSESRFYSWESVQTHNSKEDLWIVIDGKVYDVTSFQDNHPGGPAILLGKGGNDASRAFSEANHTQNAKDQLKDYLIGKVEGPKPENKSSNSLLIVALGIIVLGIGFFIMKNLLTQNQ